MFQVGISSLKLAPTIARNIKNIIGLEKPVVKLGKSKNQKTFRVKNEYSSDIDIPTLESKYEHLNLKINPKPLSKGTFKGNFDVPIEHLSATSATTNRLTNDPKIRSQYPVNIMTEKFALKNIDDPFFEQLGKQYGNQTYMGEKFPRLSRTLLIRLANLNRKKVGNELGVELPLRKVDDSSIMKVLKRTNPDIETLPANKRYLTRGGIKRNKTLNDYLSELEPATGMPRYKTMTNQ